MKTAAIVNPRAANGRCQRRWEAQRDALRDVVGPMKFCPTERQGHGTEMTRALLQEGYDHIISAGGDGTNFEVVNGWMANGAPINPDARMTVLPMGTGSDLAKSLGIAPGLRGIEALRDARTIRADVGALTCPPSPGAPPKTYYFLNLVHFGIGGTTCRYVNEHSKALGGFLSYLKALVVTLTTYNAKSMLINVDNRIILNETALDFSVAKGRFDAGGLMMAPHARLDNGWFDCHHIGPIGFMDALRTLPKVYTGRLSERRDVVKYFRGAHIEATSSEHVEVEVDGEFVGVLPATVKLIPGAMGLTQARRED